MTRTLLAVLLVLSTVVSACSAGDGRPPAPGQYDVQKGSVHFDGDRYQLFWSDQNGSLHRMDTRNVKLVRDPARTFLEVPQSGDPILHLTEDEPVTVDGQDRQGAFSSPWFPFLVGATLGNALGGRGGGQTIVINNPAPGESGTYAPNSPAYRYPPTGSFGRDDELHGSLDSSKPNTPDYSKVQPAPYATTGKSSGTGAGSAVSNKVPGSVSNATSAQAGGTGGGTAASSKGGFSSGSQSYSSSTGSSGVGAGSRGVLGGTSSSGASSSKTSTGVSSSGSKGISGARPASGGRR
ncbi:MAG: hypothetical protein JOY61_02200 [Chloroflexi bacterium]|nr:hypothetical protein [Chloroflexota bacterium]